MRKFHFTYKVVHVPSGRYYLGKHTTRLLSSLEQDRYLGSGTIWKKILNAHPEHEFSREVLQEFSTKDEVNIAEQVLITEEVLKDPLCQNLITGGTGGDPANFYQRFTPTEIAQRGANTLKAQPLKVAERNRKIADKAKDRPQEYSEAKAALMRSKVTTQSRKKQGEALRKSINQKMTKFLQELSPHKDLTVPALCKLFPMFSHSSVARARTMARNGSTKWELCK